MRRKRSATAVWGTLINFTAMKRINTRGLASANKCLIMSATCYNLKKWMKQKLRYSNQNLQALTKEAERGLKQAANTVLSLIKACFTPPKYYKRF